MEPKFNKNDFVFFGELNTHVQVMDIFKTSIDEDGFRWRYLIKFSNLGTEATKWEHELH